MSINGLILAHTFGGTGSAIENSGSARLAKVFRYASIGRRWITLYSSRHTSPEQTTSTERGHDQSHVPRDQPEAGIDSTPVARDVAVAIAGMILPAINFAFSLSTSY